MKPSVSEVVSLLGAQRLPVHALLDAGRDPEVLTLIYEHDAKARSLYAGSSEARLGSVGPFLVTPEEPLLAELVGRGFGKAWGLFLTSDAGFDDLRKHFRTLLMVRRQKDGSELYFRFYDPRVLRAFLPTCRGKQVAQMFGPVQSFLIEDEEGASLLRFVAGAEGVGMERLDLIAEGERAGNP